MATGLGKYVLCGVAEEVYLVNLLLVLSQNASYLRQKTSTLPGHQGLDSTFAHTVSFSLYCRCYAILDFKCFYFYYLTYKVTFFQLN